MSNIFSYLFESSLILAVMYIFFFFVLRRRTQPEFNRFYLLFSLAFAVAVPLISVPITFNAAAGESSFWPPVARMWNFLPELVITAGGSSSANPDPDIITLPGLIAFFYLTGVLISGTFTLRKLMMLRKLINRFADSFEDRGFYKITETNGRLPTLSFLGYVFWDNTVPLSENEKKQVLHHELAHIKQKHSVDLLFMEVLSVIYWFNPFIYAYRHSLSQVHEHLADRYAVTTVGEAEKESYLKLMVKQTLRQANLPLSSSFFQHNTLNRIHMLQHKPTLTILKAALGACIIGIVFFVAACHDEEIVSNEHSEAPPAPAATEAPPAEFSMLVETFSQKQDGPPLAGIKVEIKDKAVLISAEKEVHIISKFKDKETYEQTAEYARQLEGQKIAGKSVTEGLNKIGNGKILHIREEAGNNLASAKNIQPDKTSGGDIIFEVVEHQPKPQGGMESFYKMIGENLKYPEEAVANRIEGIVYIQFVVEKDGSLSEVKAVKGVGHGLDEAATEVIRASAWEPGRQNGEAVAVRMVMPIKFQL